MANDAIKFLNDMRSTQRGFRLVALVSLGVAALVSIAAVFLALSYVEKSKSEVFVLDQGAALEAQRATNGAQKDLEVIDHVTRFHELFFNIAPNITAINQNISRAMELADESAYKYFTDLKEQRYFATLININATQQIVVDTVAVAVDRYPYLAKTKASLYVLRESNISLYSIETECELVEVARTRTNPHGLMMRKYYATKPQLIETRPR
jgi:conjugative transposon TraK protein